MRVVDKTIRNMYGTIGAHEASVIKMELQKHEWKISVHRRFNGGMVQRVQFFISNTDGKLIRFEKVRNPVSFWRGFLKYWREITILALGTWLAGELSGLFNRLFH